MSERQLHRGDTGPEVAAVQALLHLAGLDAGGRDGEFGERTAQAVREVQKRAGMAQDGVVGPATRKALERAAATGRLPLTPSVRSLLATSSPVTAAGLAADLYAGHPDYPEAERAVEVLSAAAGDGTERPPPAWVADAVDGLDPSALGDDPLLHGRLLLYALSRLDPGLASVMERAELVQPLVRAITPPPDRAWGGGGGDAPAGARVDAQLVSDEPAIVDRLDREPFGRAFATLLRRQRDKSFGSGPILVHLFGPWGAGKSSLFNWIRRELETDRRAEDEGRPSSGPWLCVTFNAWRHQRTAPPWWWLIDAVYHGARRSKVVDRRTRRRIWWWRWGYVVGAVLAAAAVLAAVAVVGAAVLDSATRLQGLLDQLIKVTGAVGAVLVGLRTARSALLLGSPRSATILMRSGGDPLRKVQDRYLDLVEGLGMPLLVFIDDLDRCQPSYVVELLEGINTILINRERRPDDAPATSRAVTYLVAADREWLCESFEHEYDTFGAVMGRPGKPLGYLFLEKTFAVSAPIPTTRPATRKRYWRTVLGTEQRPTAQGEGAEVDLATATPEEAVAAAAAVATDDTLAGRSVREQAALRVAEGAIEGGFDHLLEPYLALMEPNPRALKRLRNAYAVSLIGRVVTGTASADPAAEDGLIRWCIISLRWPRLAIAVAERPELLERLAAGDGGGLSSELAPLAADAALGRVLHEQAGGRASTLVTWAAGEFAEVLAASHAADADVDLRDEVARA